MEKFGRNDLECLVVNLKPDSTICVATLLDLNLTKFAKHVVIDSDNTWGGKLYLHKPKTANQS